MIPFIIPDVSDEPVNISELPQVHAHAIDEEEKEDEQEQAEDARLG